MKPEDFLSAMEFVDDALLSEAAAPSRRRRAYSVRQLAAAAAFVLVFLAVALAVRRLPSMREQVPGDSAVTEIGQDTLSMEPGGTPQQGEGGTQTAAIPSLAAPRQTEAAAQTEASSQTAAPTGATEASVPSPSAPTSIPSVVPTTVPTPESAEPGTVSPETESPTAELQPEPSASALPTENGRIEQGIRNVLDWLFSGLGGGLAGGRAPTQSATVDARTAQALRGNAEFLLSATPSEGALAWETVTVTVRLKNAAQTASVKAALDYDADALTFVSAKNGVFSGGGVFSDPASETVYFDCVPAQPAELTEETVLTAVFRVSDRITASTQTQLRLQVLQYRICPDGARQETEIASAFPEIALTVGIG